MRLPVFALILLAGCGGPEAVSNQSGSAGSSAASNAKDDVAVATPQAEGPQPSASAPQDEGAAPAGAFQWTGRYAASRELCRSGGVWEITNAKVTTGGETSCTINDVVEEGGRVRLALSCLAEGMRSEERWTLTPRDGDGITLRREGAGAPYEVDLRFC